VTHDTGPRIAIAVALAALAALAPSQAGASFSHRQERKLERAVAGWKREMHYPGLEAGLWQQGAGSFRTVLGIASRDTRRPLGLRDRFQIGSITKTFTATLVLQLVEHGKLGLDDPVSGYVGFLSHGDEITIRELLDMTSGLHTYPNDLMEDIVGHPHRDWRPVELARRSVTKKRYCAIANAGTASCYHYTNTNYILLGLIVRQVTPPAAAEAV
jgi:D-alanyl-D-alanine carboxypeptidase